MKHKLRRTPLLFISAFAFTFLVSAELFIPRNETESDIPTVTIGSQVWMAENLNSRIFRNGDSIPVFTGHEDWYDFGTYRQGACAMYNNSAVSAQNYGLLYNWYAVSDPRGICPEGFRVPTDDDFIELLNFAGGKKFSSENAMKGLRFGGNSKFNAKFGGWCCMDNIGEDVESPCFVNMGQSASFWSATESDGSEYYLDEIAVSLELGSSWRTDTHGAYIDPTSSKWNAYSVRCIKE